jgi:uncharacterized repeat protein (TIGR01451 family)
MRTRAWCTSLVLASLAVACGDQPTEVVPEREMTQGPATVAFATSSSDDGLSITTDKDDYAPGDTVWFTGAGWPANDTLDILLEDEPATHEPHTWWVPVGEDGGFRDSTYVVDVSDLGVRFTLTATSRATGRSLTVTFTDGNIRVNGTPLGVTFDLLVEKFGTPQNPTTTCSGTVQSSAPESITGVSGQGENVGGINGNESFRLTAALTSTSGGGFQNWSPPVGATGGSGNTPYTEVDPAVPPATTSRSICVPGFAGGGNSGNYTANYTPVPDLRIIKTAAPASFTVGSNATFTLAVSNIGQLATSGTVTVEDILPAGLTFVSAVGTGWTCSGTSSVSCTRSNALAAGSAYPNIVITVTPTPPATPSITNTSSVSGGGDVSPANNSSTVNVTVVGVPDLSIDKSHTGNFTRGTNENYTLEVSNVGSAATSAAVTVTDTLPAGLTFVSGTGTGWNACTAAGQVVSCVRLLANPIASGATAPAITLTVDVGAGTASAITNRARVSGGGEPAPNLVACDGSHNNCDADPTTVVNANSPPIANDDAYTTDEDVALSVVAADGVLKNDTDPDGNALTAVLVSGPDPAKTAAFTLNADGSFSFTPATDFNGSVTFSYRANDGLVNSVSPATVTITVNPVNDPPSFAKGADQTVLEDAGPVSVDPWATAISKGPADESGQTIDFMVTNNTNAALFSAGPAVSPTGVLTFTPAPNANGVATITLVLKDNGGTANGGNDTSAPQSFMITVTPVNDPPSFTKGSDQTTSEGAGTQTVTGWATAISAGPPDESGQALTFVITGNTNPGIFSVAPAIASNGTLTYTPSLGPNGSSTITVRLEDGGGTANGGNDTSGEQSFTITVDNVLPSLGPITAPTDPKQVGTLITASATFSDPGTADPHTTYVDWGDGTVTTYPVAGGSTTASGSHTYTSPGVYTLRMKVQDDVGYSNEVLFQYVVIYDPSAGFVTGGGWINSPAGAYTPEDPSDPDITGKANFGFVSKYQKGATIPIGNTEFQFHAADLNFKSTAYEWLVVQGNSSKASYKGSGTVNGTGNYGFLLSVVDVSSTGDKFRIKIWNKATNVILYDNQTGAGDDATASQLIAGGSIVIHSK